MNKLKGGKYHASIVSLAVSPDDRWLAACEGMDPYKPVKEPVRLWDLHDLSKDPQPVSAKDALNISFGPDGHEFYYLTSGGGISYQPIPLTGRPKRFLPKEFISTFYFTPDGSKLIAGGNRAFGWDVKTKKTFDVPMEGLDFTIDKYFVATAILGVNCTALRADGAVISAVVNERVGKTDQRRYTLQTFSFPDGRCLVKSKPFEPTPDDTTRPDSDSPAARMAYEFAKAQAPAIKEVRRLVYSPDGRFLAGLRKHDVIVWDAETLSEQATLQPSAVRDPYQLNTASLACLAFTPDGRRLAVGCRGNLDVHRPGTGEAKTSFWDTATWEKQPNLNCGCDTVYALAFCRDGRLIAGADFVPMVWEPGEY